MDIKIKFNIKDKVFYLYSNRIETGIIIGTKIEINRHWNINIIYNINTDCQYSSDILMGEDKIYLSKWELLEFL